MGPSDYYDDEFYEYDNQEEDYELDPEAAIEADILEKQESGFHGSEYDW